MDSVKGVSGTFWTQCPSCKIGLEYAVEFLNKTLICPPCKTVFVATEMVTPEKVIPPMPRGRGKKVVPGDNAVLPSPRGRSNKGAPSRNPTPPAPGVQVNGAGESVDSTPSGVKQEKGLEDFLEMDSVRGVSGTFWTQCPSCKIGLEYAVEFLNKTLICPPCKTVFVATEMVTPEKVIPPMPRGRGKKVAPGDNTVLPPPRGRSNKGAPSRNPTPPAPGVQVNEAVESVDSTPSGVKQEKGRKKVKTSAAVDQIKSHFDC